MRTYAVDFAAFSSRNFDSTSTDVKSKSRKGMVLIADKADFFRILPCVPSPKA
jgi:hypothetical protein